VGGSRDGFAHGVQHLLGEFQVEEGVDQQGRLAIDDEAGVTPAPGAVGLQVGVDGVAEIVQAFGVGPGAHVFPFLKSQTLLMLLC